MYNGNIFQWDTLLVANLFSSDKVVANMMKDEAGNSSFSLLKCFLKINRA